MKLLVKQKPIERGSTNQRNTAIKNYRKLLHYNTTLAIIFLFPLVLFSGELSEILTVSEAIYDSGFWMLMVKYIDINIKFWEE